MNATLRSLVRETTLSMDDFIYPLFIHEGPNKEEITSMPDCYRLTLKDMMDEVEDAMRYVH